MVIVRNEEVTSPFTTTQTAEHKFYPHAVSVCVKAIDSMNWGLE